MMDRKQINYPVYQWERMKEKGILEFIPDPESDVFNYPTPVWSQWGYMRLVPLFQAILLVLDIDPDFSNDMFDPVTLERIHQLEKIAKSHSIEDPVVLVDFGKFIEDLDSPWTLPSNFPRPRAVEVIEPVEPAIPVEPLPSQNVPVDLVPSENQLPYMTDKFLELFEIMRKVEKLPSMTLLAAIREVTTLSRSKAQVLATLINRKPDGRSHRWLK